MKRKRRKRPSPEPAVGEALTRKVLIGLSRQVGSKRITPAEDAFWDLVTSVEYLHEALARAANRST